MIVTARKPEVEASAGRPRVGASLVRLTPPPAREGRALAGTMIKPAPETTNPTGPGWQRATFYYDSVSLS